MVRKQTSFSCSRVHETPLIYIWPNEGSKDTPGLITHHQLQLCMPAGAIATVQCPEGFLGFERCQQPLTGAEEEE